MNKPTYKELEERIRDLEQAEVLRKRAQEALRQSEEKFRTLVENITVGIFRSTPDPKGRFLEVNPALVQMLGYENKGELLSKDVCEIYQSLEDRLRFCEKISRDGFVKHEEFNFRKKDGTPIVVSNTAMAASIWRNAEANEERRRATSAKPRRALITCSGIRSSSASLSPSW